MQPNTNTNNRKTVFLMLFFGVLSLILGISGLVREYHHQRETGQLAQNKAALNAELIRVKDQAGKLETGRRVLMADNKSFLNLIAEKDSEIWKLQQEIKKDPKNTQAVTLLTTETKANYSVKTQIRPEAVKDTTNRKACPDSLKKAPVYTGTISSPYDTVKVEAGPDSIRVKIKHIETGVLRQINYKTKWYKERQPVMFYNSTNPNTEVKNILPYVVEKPGGSNAGYFLKGTAAGAALFIIVKGLFF